MFTLQDGREHLYQWDLDRYIVVNDDKICEVHFCNRTSDCSLVVEVKDGLAAIPNILLQDARPIRAYAYCDDKYTLTESQFTVKSRTRPSDYVYEETEVVRVDVLLDKAEEAITNALELTEYFDTHKLEVKDDGQGNVTLEAIVPEGGGGGGGDADLSNYYTKAQTDAAISTAIADLDIPDVTGFAKLEDIPTIPENVSSFNNDAGYLTEVPSEYITETELAGKGYLTEHQSLDGYAKTTDIPDVSKYQTEEQVTALINEALGVIENGTY